MTRSGFAKVSFLADVGRSASWETLRASLKFSSKERRMLRISYIQYEQDTHADDAVLETLPLKEDAALPMRSGWWTSSAAGQGCQEKQAPLQQQQPAPTHTKEDFLAKHI